MKTGWARIYRQIEENPLWLSEKFTKGQAWIDMILFTNHKDGSFWVRGNEVQIKRGQIAWSEITMANRWRWSRNKVRRFLEWLETEQQIKQQKSNITTLVTIINYDKFQQETIQQTIQQKDSRRYTNKNDKNEKNEKNNNISLETFFSYFLKEGTNDVMKKSERFDLRDQDVNFFANECMEWYKHNSPNDRSWFNWDKAFNKWINDGIYLYKKKRTKTMRARDEEKASQPKKPKYASVEDYYLKEEGVTIIG